MKHTTILSLALLLLACGPEGAVDLSSSSTSDTSTGDAPMDSSSTSTGDETSEAASSTSGGSATDGASTSEGEGSTSSTGGDAGSTGVDTTGGETSTGADETGDISTGDMGGACWADACDEAAQPCAAGLTCDIEAGVCVAPCVAVALDVWACVPNQGFGCQEDEAPGVCKPALTGAVMCYPA